jgi:hypothetical protein
MRAGFGLLVAVLSAFLAGSGCCRLCHCWCDGRDDYHRYGPPPEGHSDPPPAPQADTRARYEGDPHARAARRDDRPTGDPRFDHHPVGAYGGTGN